MQLRREVKDKSVHSIVVKSIFFQRQKLKNQDIAHYKMFFSYKGNNKKAKETAKRAKKQASKQTTVFSNKPVRFI